MVIPSVGSAASALTMLEHSGDVIPSVGSAASALTMLEHSVNGHPLSR